MLRKDVGFTYARTHEKRLDYFCAAVKRLALDVCLENGGNMEISSLIRSRRTIHSFRESVVEESLIYQALELALWAPNHKLTRPWRFTLIGPQVRKQLADLSVQIKEKEAQGELTQELKNSLRAKILQPSALVVVSVPKVRDEVQAREDYATMAAGLQNSALFLWSKGIGSKWSTGKIMRHVQTYSVVGISSEMEEIIGFFWIGYADKTPAAPARPILQDCLRMTN